MNSIQLAVNHDDETGALLRLSTQQADAGNWDAAIATLRLVRERMLASDTIYPIETWCKLPLYLSRAGRFEEAEAAFDWLLADLPRRAAKESGIDEPDPGEQKARRKKLYDIILNDGVKIIEEKRAVVMRRRQPKAAG